MTTRQISQAIGKDERTVRRWVKRAADKVSTVADKMAAASFRTNGADWDLEESVAIIEIGMGRNAAALFRENALRTSAGIPAPESIAAIVRDTIAAMVPVLIAAVRGAIPDQAVAALPAPEPMTPRNQLRQAINAYAAKIGGHREAWNTLYQQFYYRYHRNLRECARNRDMDTLDYAEEEGLMPELVSLAAALNGGR